MSYGLDIYFYTLFIEVRGYVCSLFLCIIQVVDFKSHTKGKGVGNVKEIIPLGKSIALSWKIYCRKT